MNKRRKLLIALGSSALAVPLASFAQEHSAKIARIGFLIAEPLSGQASRAESLRAGLRDLGYIEGKNITIEIRSADGHYDRLPELAAELARLKVDVLVAFGAKAVLAAKRVTITIPIVIPSVSDPVALGLTRSLARPSGNITGSSMFGPEVAAKRVELLKEAVPRTTQVAALLNPANASSGPTLQAMRVTAKLLKMELQPFEVRAHKEIASTFSAMAKKRVTAIVVQQDTMFSANAKEIVELAEKNRLLSVGNKEFAEGGGLIGYGANDAELYRRGAYYVDKILKGAKPGDLPIEQPTKFELVVNGKTAKTLGIKLPQSILVRVDKLIE